MAPRSSRPNRRLHRLMDDSGMSNKGLARRVLNRASEVGVTGLRYDHSSVIRWLAGQQPRHPAPELIADVLARELGRTVTPADIGMTPSPARPDLGLDYPAELANSITAAVRLWRADLGERRWIRDAGYAPGAYAPPALRWLTAPAEPINVERPSDPAEVHSIRDITSLFRRLDNQWGGGHTRSTVVQYLATELPPLLHGRHADGIEAELMSAIAELTHLAGWMAYDLELHGLAQRYLIQALRQTRAAGDIALGAEILSGMAQQAIYVGQPHEAVDLARAAGFGARKASLPTLISETLITEARALAKLRDHKPALHNVAAAERALDSAEPDAVPPWLRYFDEAYLSAQLGHCLRDLGDLSAAERHAHRSLRMATGYTRGRTFNLTLLAGIHVKQGELEHAAVVGNQALDSAVSVKSERARHRLHDLFTALLPYAGQPAVSEFTDRARDVVATSGGDLGDKARP